MVDLRQLSAHDRRVLALLRTGLDDAAIATTMSVSPRTVEVAVRRLLRLTGAVDRADLAVRPL